MNEIERRALEERRTSPRYARYRFLRGFKVSLREVVYGVEWVTVRSPVLYRGEGEDEGGGGVAQGGGAGAQGPPPAHVGREVEHQALDPGAKVGDFKYVVVDGKYVKLRGGRRGVLIIALGLTDHGVRAVLDVVLTREEDVVSY